MRKTLIIILTIVLLALAALLIFRGIQIGNFKIESIYNIKQKSKELDESLGVCLELTNTKYPQSEDDLQKAIKEFQKNKQEYEALALTDENTEALATTQIKKYKIEYLWTIIGNYAKDEGIDLTIQLVQGSATDSYNINFIASGSYIGITNFIYKIEDDEDLNFKIESFEIGPTTLETTQGNQISTQNNQIATQGSQVTQTKVKVDNTNLKSTFSVLDIGIILD